MEGLILLVISCSVGYLVSKIDKIEAKVDRLENEVISISVNMPKRKTDDFS